MGKEEQCMEKKGILMESGEDLLEARYDFAKSMKMNMMSMDKMSAVYPDEQLRSYENYCKKYNGKMHTIKIDFFDCIMLGAQTDIELTIKDFANCMADVPECEGFNQEHLLQEAWKELGLNCELEEEETKKYPPKKQDDDFVLLDDDLAKKEEESAAEGVNDADEEEKKSEYV